MEQRIIKSLSILLVIPILSFCTRIEDDYVLPNSTPYKLYPSHFFNYQPFNDDKFTIERVQVESFTFDSLYVFAFFSSARIKEVLPSNEQSARSIGDTWAKNGFKGIALFSIGSTSVFLEQVNFLKEKYEKANSVVFVPFLDDFNNNKSIDQIFLINYNDSAVIQIRDQILQKYPSSEDININDEFYNIVVDKSNGARINFTFIWKIGKNKAYVAFQKTNRVTAVKSKVQDTLILFNPYNKEIKKVCLPPGSYSDKKGSFILDHFYPKRILEGKNIYMLSLPVKNGHNYNQIFNDYNSYIIALDTNFHIIWYDSVKIHSEPSLSLPVYIDNSSIGIVKRTLRGGHQGKSNLYVYSLNDGKINAVKDFPKLPENPILSFKKDTLIFIYFNTQRLIININNNKVQKETLPVSISLFSSLLSSSISEDIIPSKLNSISFDINKDGTNDLLFETKMKQICCFDGKSNEILFSTAPFKDFVDWGIGYDFEGNPILLVNDNNRRVETFLIAENSFLNRFFANISVFAFIATLVFIPVLGIFLYFAFIKIMTLKKLISKNENFGYCLLRQIAKSKLIKPIAYNKTYLTMMKNLTSAQLVSSEYKIPVPPEVAKEILGNGISKSPTNVDIHFFDNNDERKLFKASISKFKIFNIVHYFVISIFEATDSEKSELFNMTLYSVHNAKNSLYIIQNTVENLSYELKNYRDLNIIHKTQRIMKHVSLVANSLKSLVVISDTYAPKKENIDINLFVQKWLRENVYEYEYQEIDFKLLLADKPIIVNCDERQLSVALHCLIDNSVQAVQKKKDKQIIIHTSEYANGKAVIEVEDNGCGMKSETVNNILNSNTPQRKYGTGLGLKIVKKVCELNNAKLAIESIENIGTTVKIIMEANYGSKQN